ncbi:hypothetical protein [Nocardia farcinica]|uniref:hypothetical protein n=1 Tax=Nocardia farcinica TaxID=37329 RepID=UPI001894ADD6|nr:hypothetical protein [Nocardia farcinica]MBF6234891.1 hypothetical protein [Nocardia farcinica]MBF6445335.1 hypothetical protein [Nocardia farcinica]
MSSLLQRRNARAARARILGVSAFVAFWAYAGAVGLVGGGADLDAHVIERLPFRSPGLAGILLALLVAVPMSLTAVLSLRSHPATAYAAVLSGSILTCWVAVQPFVIGEVNWLQFVFGVLGIADAGLGFRLLEHPSRSGHHRRWRLRRPV